MPSTPYHESKDQKKKKEKKRDQVDSPFGCVLDIMKWFKRWGVKDRLQLPSDAMKYVIIEDRLLEALRMKWQDDKMSELECYFAYINQQY